jgi:hypothetical protein
LGCRSRGYVDLCATGLLIAFCSGSKSTFRLLACKHAQVFGILFSRLLSGAGAKCVGMCLFVSRDSGKGVDSQRAVNRRTPDAAQNPVSSNYAYRIRCAICLCLINSVHSLEACLGPVPEGRISRLHREPPGALPGRSTAKRDHRLGRCCAFALHAA